MNKPYSQIVLQNYESGQITKDAMERMIADDLIKTIHDYRPRSYELLNQGQHEYIQNRMCGVKTLTDEAMLKTLVDWRMNVFKADAFNAKSIELIKWSQETFKRYDLPEKVAYLQRTIDEHDNNVLDYKTYNDVLAVMSLDIKLLKESKRSSKRDD